MPSKPPLPPNHYIRGTRVKMEAVFEANGARVDPSTVTAFVKDPDGAVTEPNVTRVSLGVYTAEVFADLTGTWTYRFEGEGDGQSAGEKAFVVAASEFD